MEKYINFNKNIDYSKLEAVGKSIKNAGLAIFPTETVYGIGTNGLDAKAIEKLYNVKERSFDKPITLLVSSMNMVENLACNISETEYKLMQSFFPGPLTIILEKKEIIPDILTANKKTIGIRMPDCQITQKLIEYAGCPIATSSANISGKSPNINVNNCIKDFYEKVDYIIDNGESDIGIASTIVQVIDGIPHILREGTITKKQILEVL